ncbi:unnamed protein product [Rotaria socialis]|uniref:Uncharacterized protein n=2 Tax=Rotaria socialis TaxID=392032 RepID=A0A818XLB6_9BILA|nr:unnamed protein product [Rotaria socialis]CAF4604727.1 unnamed protein product [Rotaria socialis]
MFSKYELSLFSTQWIDGSEGIFIRSGLALIAIGTTGYVLNKVFNSPPVINSSEESPATNGMIRNRVYSTAVKEHLRATYAHFAGGLMMVGGFAYLFHRCRWSVQLFELNRWVSTGAILLLSIGSSVATRLIDQHQYPVLKYTAWSLFNSWLALSLSPLCYLDVRLLAHACLLTASTVVSISAIGMTTRRENYLWLGAPLLAGVSVVCLASISPLILPAIAIGTLSLSEFISLNGGLVVFTGALLSDMQKMIDNAESAQDVQTLSPTDQSIDIYLDAIHIFVRILSVIIENEKRKKEHSALNSKTE